MGEGLTRALVALAVVAVAGGCTSLSGLSGGGSDAGAEAVVAVAEEAGVDAGVATRDSEAPSPGFCATLDASDVVFCDDFDQPNRMSLAMEGWGPVSSAVDGVIEDASAYSHPNGASFSFDAPDGGSRRSAVQKTFSFPADKASFVVQAEIRPSLGVTRARAISIQLVGTGCSVDFGLAGDVELYCPIGLPGPPSSALAQGTWTPVSLTLTRVGGGILEVTVQTGAGPSAVTGSKNLVVTDAGASLGLLDMTVQIGDGTEATSGGEVYLDNVVVMVH